ncbi:MAG: response regulator transcription factor [Burkholderiaceae bacterium]|nr:response regulator transcription factor [Burkholderiaceae bacterium]
MISSPSVLDAFLATVVRLAGARAGTLQVTSPDGKPDLFASWERASDVDERIRVSCTAVVLPLESEGRTLGLFTLHYDPPAGGPDVLAASDAAPPQGDAEKGAAAAPAAAHESLSGTLTQREREILSRIASGQSNKTIARSLGISPDTVKLHVRHIMVKLGCRSRVVAAVLAARHGLAGERA